MQYQSKVWSGSKCHFPKFLDRYNGRKTHVNKMDDSKHFSYSLLVTFYVLLLVTSYLLFLVTFTCFSLHFTRYSLRVNSLEMNLFISQNHLLKLYNFLHRTQSYGIRQLSLTLLFSAITLIIIHIVRLTFSEKWIK